MANRAEKVSEPFDVLVIGGGPAGSTLATFLQRAGHRCIILERGRFPRYHIGESLIPHTYGTLERLGLIPALKASSFPVKHSVRFVSPSGEDADPFYFSETIDGERAHTWQVERSEFDRICLDNARDAGVDVRSGMAVKRVLFDGDRATGALVMSSAGDLVEIKAKVVADASGRASIIGTQLGLTDSVPGLKKATLWSYYKGGARLSGIDAGETTVFMIPGRDWFWYIPLPDDMVSVGIVASPEKLYGDGSVSPQDAFLREIEACAPLSERLESANRTQKVMGLREMAYRNRRMAGDGWIMIGDAMAFLDPIYSSGIFLALGSAELAANSVIDALGQQDVSEEKLGAHLPALGRGVDVIRHLIHAFYDPDFSFRKFVKRFPEERPHLIDCLVGDVIDKDMSSFLEHLAQMTPPPPSLEGAA